MPYIYSLTEVVGDDVYTHRFEIEGFQNFLDFVAAHAKIEPRQKEAKADVVQEVPKVNRGVVSIGWMLSELELIGDSPACWPTKLERLIAILKATQQDD